MAMKNWYDPRKNRRRNPFRYRQGGPRAEWTQSRGSSRGAWNNAADGLGPGPYPDSGSIPKTPPPALPPFSRPRPAWQSNPKYDLAPNFRGTRKQANKYGLAEPQLKATYTAGPGKGKSALIPGSKRGAFVGIKNGMVGVQLDSGVLWTQKGGTVYDKGGLGGNPGHGKRGRKRKGGSKAKGFVANKKRPRGKRIG